MAEIIQKVELKEIQPLRALFLQETNFQVRYNACHERGWTDSYAITINGLAIGYGSIKGQEREDRDTVFEYFIVPSFRKRSRELFRQLLTISDARYIECQSNDMLLSSMLYEFSNSIRSDVMLFKDHAVTEHALPDALARSRADDDQVFEHRSEPVGDYVVDVKGDVIATGGFLLHYNKPFADLYMEVREDCRGRGVGCFIVQEIKKECYLAGRVPAARCNIQNAASRATMIKAGLENCGYILLGEVVLSHL